MSLEEMTLHASPTITVTGTSDLAFTNDGVAITNGLHLICPDDLDFRTRRTMTFKNRPATLNPKTGEYGKDKRLVSITIPEVDASGRVQFNTIRLERDCTTTFSVEDVAKLMHMAVQVLTDPETQNFWSYGGLK